MANDRTGFYGNVGDPDSSLKKTGSGATGTANSGMIRRLCVCGRTGTKRVPDAHPSPKGWPEHCVWSFFTNKTLLERAGLRTGAPRMGAFISGVWVSGTPCIPAFLRPHARAMTAR